MIKNPAVSYTLHMESWQKALSTKSSELHCKLTCWSEITSDSDMTVCKDTLREAIPDTDYIANFPCLHKIAQYSSKCSASSSHASYWIMSYFPQCCLNVKVKEQQPYFSFPFLNSWSISFLSAIKKFWSIVTVQCRLEGQYYQPIADRLDDRQYIINKAQKATEQSNIPATSNLFEHF